MEAGSYRLSSIQTFVRIRFLMILAPTENALDSQPVIKQLLPMIYPAAGRLRITGLPQSSLVWVKIVSNINSGVDAVSYTDSKGHGANMGPIWGRQGPGGHHVGPMNFAIWVPLGTNPFQWHYPCDVAMLWTWWRHIKNITGFGVVWCTVSHNNVVITLHLVHGIYNRDFFSCSRWSITLYARHNLWKSFTMLAQTQLINDEKKSESLSPGMLISCQWMYYES